MILQIVVNAFNLLVSGCVVELEEFISIECFTTLVFLGILLEKTRDPGIISTAMFVGCSENELSSTLWCHFINLGVFVQIEPFTKDLFGFWSKTFVLEITDWYDCNIFLDCDFPNSDNVTIF